MTNYAALPLIERARAVQAAGVFLGGPLRKFETVGRNQLSILLRNGLNLDSRVLDVGCGALRAGYWLIHFLDPDCYFGIEPNRSMLDAGREMIVTSAVLASKRPRFDHNDRFDFGAFGGQFDFVIARSIWTHTSAGQLVTMLDQFVANAPDGVLLASIKPCPWYARQYGGDTWVGQSHESGDGGTVRFRFSWIAARCRERGLGATRLDHEYGQTWLRICRRERPHDR